MPNSSAQKRAAQSDRRRYRGAEGHRVVPEHRRWQPATTKQAKVVKVARLKGSILSVIGKAEQLAGSACDSGNIRMFKKVPSQTLSLWHRETVS